MSLYIEKGKKETSQKKGVAWRAQRRIERERHLRMGDFYFRRWR